MLLRDSGGDFRREREKKGLHVLVVVGILYYCTVLSKNIRVAFFCREKEKEGIVVDTVALYYLTEKNII